MRLKIQISFILCIALSSLHAFAQKVTKENDVKTIFYGHEKLPVKQDIQIKYIRNIGGFEGDDENYFFHLPIDMAKDNDGNIFVLDRGNFRVQKFNSEGKYITSFGKRGNGPGEFTFIRTFDVNPSGEIVIGDALAHYLHFFNLEGEFIKTKKFDYMPFQFRFNEEGKIAAFSTRPMLKTIRKNGPLEFGPTLYVFDIDGNTERMIGPDHIEYRNGHHQRVFALDNNGNYYVAYNFKTKIEKYNPNGELLLQIEREIDFDIKNTNTRVKSSGSMSLAGRNNSMKLPRLNAVSVSIAVDSKDRIWVVTANRAITEKEFVRIRSNSSAGTNTVLGNTDIVETDMLDIEIYSSNGDLLTKMNPGHFIDGMRIYGDKVYFIDEKRKMSIYEYQILDK